MNPVPLRRQTDAAVRWTYSFVRPYRRKLATLALLSLAEIALRAFAPWPLKAIVDYLTGAGGARRLLAGGTIARHPALLIGAIVMSGFLVQLVHQLVLLCHTRVQARLGQSMVFDLRSRLFGHLQNISLAHHATGSAADSVYRLDADASCIEALLLKGVFPLVFSGVTLAVMFGILIRLDASLALLSMLVVPLLYANLRRSAARMESRTSRAKTAESAVITRLYESLSAISLVKMFAREDHEADRFSGAARVAIRERLAVTRHESQFSFVVGAITVAGASLVLGVGAVHVLDGRLTVGTLLVVMSYLGFVYGPLSAIATTVGSLHNALTSARRVRDVLRLPRESDPHAGAAPARLCGAVRFDAVSFAYGPGRPVLREVSFVAAPGETVALVGLSGAGKTTLVSLLARLYEPTTGRVSIDGLDVRKMPLRSLREQIAVVPQESILLSGSIADNILYGRLDASREEVIAAAAAAGCAAFIEQLPQGYDTQLGAAGAGLSGGQRQRLSIARAFLKDAPILILDEPTASLDAVAERKLLDALASLRRGRTTFVIAHRLSTIRDADRILVLDSGSITAQGRHGELLERSALYRRLCAELSRDEAAAAIAGPPDSRRPPRAPHVGTS
jgi:ATP-binding cassette, subfamily B, bacterial